MKESGMNKLIELLNEYEGDTDNPTWTLNGANEPLYGGWTAYASAYLIPSKEFGFIKWLVQNDKIDLLKLTCINPRYTEILDSDFSWEDIIIMMLSIQDNPIEFLCEILK